MNHLDREQLRDDLRRGLRPHITAQMGHALLSDLDEQEVEIARLSRIVRDTQTYAAGVTTQRDRLREAGRAIVAAFWGGPIDPPSRARLRAALAACEPASASLGVPSDTITIPAGTAEEQARAVEKMLADPHYEAQRRDMAPTMQAAEDRTE